MKSSLQKRSKTQHIEVNFSDFYFDGHSVASLTTQEITALLESDELEMNHELEFHEGIQLAWYVDPQIQLNQIVRDMKAEIIRLESPDSIFFCNIDSEYRANRKKPNLICGDVYPRYHFKHLFGYIKNGIRVNVLSSAGDIILGHHAKDPINKFINWGGNLDLLGPNDILVKPSFLCASFEEYFKFSNVALTDGSVFKLITHSTNLIRTLKLGIKANDGTGDIYVHFRNCLEAIVAKIENGEWTSEGKSPTATTSLFPHSNSSTSIDTSSCKGATSAKSEINLYSF